MDSGGACVVKDINKVLLIVISRIFYGVVTINENRTNLRNISKMKTKNKFWRLIE